MFDRSRPLTSADHLLSTIEFQDASYCGQLVDSDGYALLVKDGNVYDFAVRPSDASLVPNHIEQVVWVRL